MHGRGQRRAGERALRIEKTDGVLREKEGEREKVETDGKEKKKDGILLRRLKESRIPLPSSEAQTPLRGREP